MRELQFYSIVGLLTCHSFGTTGSYLVFNSTAILDFFIVTFGTTDAKESGKHASQINLPMV
jgi:hypothetical protein